MTPCETRRMRTATETRTTSPLGVTVYFRLFGVFSGGGGEVPAVPNCASGHPAVELIDGRPFFEELAGVRIELLCPMRHGGRQRACVFGAAHGSILTGQEEGRYRAVSLGNDPDRDVRRDLVAR